MATMATTTLKPVNGRIDVSGVIKRPDQQITIDWEVDGSSGSTTCQAWRGQFEIENLMRAGYIILSIRVEI